MEYKKKRMIAEIVLEVLTDDDEGIPNLPNVEAIEYGHKIVDKIEERGFTIVVT